MWSFHHTWSQWYLIVVTAAGTFVDPNSVWRSGSSPLYTISLKKWKYNHIITCDEAFVWTQLPSKCAVHCYFLLWISFLHRWLHTCLFTIESISRPTCPHLLYPFVVHIYIFSFFLLNVINLLNPGDVTVTSWKKLAEGHVTGIC